MAPSDSRISAARIRCPARCRKVVRRWVLKRDVGEFEAPFDLSGGVLFEDAQCFAGGRVNGGDRDCVVSIRYFSKTGHFLTVEPKFLEPSAHVVDHGLQSANIDIHVEAAV